MSENNNFSNSPQNGEGRKRPYYPPPNEAFMVLVAALVSALIIGTALATLGKGGVFLLEGLFLIPPLIYLHLKRYNIKRCMRWNTVTLPQIFTALLIGLALIVLLDEADRVINIFFPMPAELQELLKDYLKPETFSDYVILFTGTVLVAAICEESLFRGFIQVSMEAYGGITRAVLFSALLFALAHFNPWWMVQILLLGVFLGFISWRSNSAIPSICVHGLNNALALLSGGTIEGEEWAWYNSGKHVAPTVLIASAALLFIGIRLFLRTTEITFPKDTVANETAPD